MADFCVSKSSVRLIEQLVKMGCREDPLEKSEKGRLVFMDLPDGDGPEHDKLVRNVRSLVSQSGGGG